jgi:hypothetical protein
MFYLNYLIDTTDSLTKLYFGVGNEQNTSDTKVILHDSNYTGTIIKHSIYPSG